ncbi:HLA class II histocompatibility antigen, DR alpha chain-like [Platysternon megacephalum]|uniref:HLA class II histocompatibility antigen, DR alpha chain-like n=1 Tax=Platysternon megacephalum TaxID=55544 RepID=A0A4D9DPF2_9SAUR|nr:HLA class II histocompatibility antigen, DR alpha chain-like [Platysternon megacephalum]
MALPGPLLLLAALALRWAHGEIPTVRLIDQEGPILEGSYVTLECLTDEAGADMSQFTFQKYSRWLQSWVSLDNPDRLRCWFFDVNVTRADGRLLLAIGALQSWHTGHYRCVAANSTGNATASAELSLRVEYLRSVFVTRAHTWCGTVGDAVAVLEGEDLELQCSADASQPPQYEWSRQGDDWVVASSALSLPQVSRDQAGTYVCRAQHPGLPPLARSRAVRVEVQGAQSSYQLGGTAPAVADEIQPLL